ncbi:MAG: hypothetical protein ACLS90_06065 [Clostridia bacterium]
MTYVMCTVTKKLVGTKLTPFKVYSVFLENQGHYILSGGISPQPKEFFQEVPEVRSVQEPIIGSCIIIIAENGQAYRTSEIQGFKWIKSDKYVLYTVNSVYVVTYIG